MYFCAEIIYPLREFPTRETFPAASLPHQGSSATTSANPQENLKSSSQAAKIIYEKKTRVP